MLSQNWRRDKKRLIFQCGGSPSTHNGKNNFLSTEREGKGRELQNTDKIIFNELLNSLTLNINLHKYKNIQISNYITKH